MRALLSWAGLDDLAALDGNETKVSTLQQVLLSKELNADEFILLSDFPKAKTDAFVERLQFPKGLSWSVHSVRLKSPVDYASIYQAAREAIEQTRKRLGLNCELKLLLNPGTPPMGAVWLLLGKSLFPPSTLVAWTRAGRLERVDVPFEISAELVAPVVSTSDQRLVSLSAEAAPNAAAFADIVHQCEAMKRLIGRAQTVAGKAVPVLLEGESGTGKELFARAIHNASPRGAKPMIVVNCGAIPPNLIESELFGHVKDAFTGAKSARRGHFREADGGTLFLDEIGDLPPEMQVRLLRPLMENQEIVPVGESRAIRVDVGVIAATHRNLLSRVAEGLFREDLYYRLAVVSFRVPALRERKGDLTGLIQHVLDRVNAELLSPQAPRRTLSPGAKNVLLNHTWPGNVRELQNSIRRLVLFSSGPIIRTEDATEAIVQRPSAEPSPLHQPLGGDFDLRKVTRAIESHYLQRALAEADGNRTRAAKLLGLKNHQTLNNWLRRNGVEK